MGQHPRNMDVGKKVPATNIMGRAMALPIPDAAAGVRAQADNMNPMFRNTRLASGTTAKIQRDSRVSLREHEYTYRHNHNRLKHRQHK